jgi:hypothetical protein
LDSQGKSPHELAKFLSENVLEGHVAETLAETCIKAMEDIANANGDEKIIQAIEGKFTHRKAQARDVMNSETARNLYVQALQTSAYYKTTPICNMDWLAKAMVRPSGEVRLLDEHIILIVN